MHCRKVSKTWTVLTVVWTHWGLLKNLRALGPYLASCSFLWFCVTGSAGSAQLPGVTSCLVEALEESSRTILLLLLWKLVMGLMRLTPQLPASEPPSLPIALFSFQITFKQLDCYLLISVYFVSFLLPGFQPIFSFSFCGFLFPWLDSVFSFSTGG